MATDWAADVKKYAAKADDAVIAGIVRYCGIALRNRDSALVAFSDKTETDRVRTNFLQKKLALTQADSVLDAAIAKVGAAMKADRTKNRVTVYYLLAAEFGKLGMFVAKSAAKTPAKTPAKAAAVTAAKAAPKASAKVAAVKPVAAKAAAKPAAKTAGKALGAAAVVAGAVAAAKKPAAKTAAKPALKAAVKPAAKPAPKSAAVTTRKSAPVKAAVLTAPAKTSATGTVAASAALGGAALAAAAGGVEAVKDTAAKVAAMASDAATAAAPVASAPVSMAAAAPAPVMSSPAVKTAVPAEDDNGLGWLYWVLGGLVLLALLWFLFHRAPDAAQTGTAAVSSEAAAAPVPAADADPILAAAPTEGAVAIPTGAGVTTELRDGKPVVNVYFDTGKTDVAAAFAASAGGLKGYLDTHSGSVLNVSGYSDPSGNAAANAELSKQRAQAVQTALIAAGIAEGSAMLVKPDNSADASVPREAARRVEVVVK